MLGHGVRGRILVDVEVRDRPSAPAAPPCGRCRAPSACRARRCACGGSSARRRRGCAPRPRGASAPWSWASCPWPLCRQLFPASGEAPPAEAGAGTSRMTAGALPTAFPFPDRARFRRRFAAPSASSTSDSSVGVGPVKLTGLKQVVVVVAVVDGDLAGLHFHDAVRDAADEVAVVRDEQDGALEAVGAPARARRRWRCPGGWWARQRQQQRLGAPPASSPAQDGPSRRRRAPLTLLLDGIACRTGRRPAGVRTCD